MKTLSYVMGIEEKIEVGKEYYFGQLWDGSGDGEELLESGTVSPDNENVVAFVVLYPECNALSSVVRVTEIY